MKLDLDGHFGSFIWNPLVKQGKQVLSKLEKLLFLSPDDPNFKSSINETKAFTLSSNFVCNRGEGNMGTVGTV